MASLISSGQRSLCGLDKYRVNNYRTTAESDYVTKNLGTIITKCLVDVCEKRPGDPIEYIAHWIYNNRANEIRHREEAEEQMRIQQAKVEKEREDELLLLGRPHAPEPYSLHRLSSLSDFSYSSIPQSELNRVSSEPTAAARNTPDVFGSSVELA